MHPIFSDNRNLLWYMAAWLCVGLFIAALMVMTGHAPLARSVIFAVPATLVFGFEALSAYYLCRSLPFAQRRWPAAIGVFGGASLLSGVYLVAICFIWNSLGRAFGEDQGIVFMRQNLIVMFFAAGVLFYLLSIFAHDVLIAFESVRESAQREAESRVLARDAELQLLRTQINPHFLFNSLNSISALTSIDGAAAREMTIALAQFFRQTLALSERDKIPLASEIALCENFLAIEKNRFGKKLGCSIQVDDRARSCLFPPMALQPLVENAVKHGIRNLDGGGVVTIDAVARDGWLHISIANPVGALLAPGEGNGLGLRNIRERLAVLYGDRARIAWEHADDTFLVEISLPAERDERAST
jgi:two-component system, LytTR family, sensor histidine kinase AlgZ